MGNLNSSRMSGPNGVRPQCIFLECTTDNLKGIADSSIDVVANRAVLAYVTDQKAAVGEFFRVLKPSGRPSIAEPVLQDDAFYARALRRRIEDRSRPVDRLVTLLHRWGTTVSGPSHSIGPCSCFS